MHSRRPSTPRWPESEVGAVGDVIFHTVPVDEAVNAVRAWAEADWPLSREQALAMLDRLGWTGSPDDNRLFTTNFDLEPEDGSLSASSGQVSAVNFRLSTYMPRAAQGETNEASWSAFNAYLESLAHLFGQPRREQRRHGTSAEWVLPNGAAILLSGSDRLLQASIESPQARASAEWAELDH